MQHKSDNFYCKACSVTMVTDLKYQGHLYENLAQVGILPVSVWETMGLGFIMCTFETCRACLFERQTSVLYQSDVST